MAHRSAYRVADAVDLRRFTAAVRDGLTARELATRFGIGYDAAKRLADKIRKGEAA